MRAVKRWRYYCDHCRRAAMLKQRMAKHELGCTLNPERKCGICELRGVEQQPIYALKNAAESGLPELRALSENCPVCILAALRQFNLDLYGEDQFWPLDFDFKAEMKRFWDGYNAENMGYQR